MGVTFGFYNSMNGDRQYNADQFSYLFDTFLTDGVFSSKLEILGTVPGVGMQVIVRPGAAWLKHTWTLNDSALPLNLLPADITLRRYDTVYLEANTSQAVRSNRIAVATGTPATNPIKPILTNTAEIKQMPLAHILIPGNTTSINAGMIQVVVGTAECPFVTGLLSQADISVIFQQWEYSFNSWWENVKATLDTNTVTNLQRQIDDRLKILDAANTSEVEAATVTNKYLSPATAGLKMATQSEAEAGTSTEKRAWSPQRVQQAVRKLRTGWAQLAEYKTAGAFNYTVPAGVTKLGVLENGGGGAGGIYVRNAADAASSGAFSNGGGSGEIRQFTITVTPGQVIPIVIGAAGEGKTLTSTASDQNGMGGDGGSTSVNGIIARGGKGGRGTSSTANMTSGAIGGQSSAAGQVWFGGAIPNNAGNIECGEPPVGGVFAGGEIVSQAANWSGVFRNIFDLFDLHVYGGAGGNGATNNYNNYGFSQTAIERAKGHAGSGVGLIRVSTPTVSNKIDATAPGDGGGAVSLSAPTLGTYRSGNGAPGYVLLYKEA